MKFIASPKKVPEKKALRPGVSESRPTLPDAKPFHMDKCSTVSSVSESMKVLISADRAMRKRAETLMPALSKSQE